jgi:hypothetical protein
MPAKSCMRKVDTTGFREDVSLSDFQMSRVSVGEVTPGFQRYPAWNKNPSVSRHRLLKIARNRNFNLDHVANSWSISAILSKQP